MIGFVSSLLCWDPGFGGTQVKLPHFVSSLGGRGGAGRIVCNPLHMIIVAVVVVLLRKEGLRRLSRDDAPNYCDSIVVANDGG